MYQAQPPTYQPLPAGQAVQPGYAHPYQPYTPVYGVYAPVQPAYTTQTTTLQAGYAAPVTVVPVGYPVAQPEARRNHCLIATTAVFVLITTALIIAVVYLLVGGGGDAPAPPLPGQCPSTSLTISPYGLPDFQPSPVPNTMCSSCDYHDPTCCTSNYCSNDTTYYWAKLVQKSEQCTDLLGLLQCAPCTAYSGQYIGRNAGGQRLDITVCQSWCDQLYDACSQAQVGVFGSQTVSEKYATSSAFCKGSELNLLVAGPGYGNTCFNAAGELLPAFYLIILVLFAVLLS
eukprot:gnl/Hemi2/2077_TR748_c0_g1_i1.p1 gnl/Hemi2/2077_TR748_c0_g1~~gnl/Hemi2/2077_TR748_c0_g1_i1.p1  ORF type:complete len:287 (+),score=107.95 gnl/Hemi2/2077_TR748_c0_g1_i1:87-947(+)